jgi:hypothetical protein
VVLYLGVGFQDLPFFLHVFLQERDILQSLAASMAFKVCTGEGFVNFFRFWELFRAGRMREGRINQLH